jgi:Plasmid pRiA4b ORF-3-like protein
MLFQFKIQLKHLTDPTVWRQLLIPDYFTFHRFHKVIQVAFGWKNYHLYQFSPKGYGSEPNISLPDPESDMDFPFKQKLDSQKTKLLHIFTIPKQKYIYIYDFGDDWTHIITLQKILDQKRLNAELLSAAGACPPEDCGGFPGYWNLQKIINDPKHPEHNSMKEWMGLSKKQNWDAAYFDLEKRALMVRKV